MRRQILWCLVGCWVAVFGAAVFTVGFAHSIPALVGLGLVCLVGGAYAAVVHL